MNKPLFSLIFFSFFTCLLFAQAPTGLSGTGYRTTVHLHWDDYTAFEAVGFNIYRSTNSGSYGAPARRVGAYSDYTDYNLTPSTTYYYTITAFDDQGNESPLSSEIMVATNENDYLKVASLDLLIPIYKGGITATAPQEIREGLEFARGIFFRNSHAQLNLKYHFMEIDSFAPPNADGLADFNTIGADLTARGILDNQYDAIHIEAVQLYGWRGGALWLGETAGSMGYNWTGYDPDNHYSRGDAWLFTHEFGHSLDLIIAQRSGYPEMLFNHFPWAHPMPPEIGVFDAGENFDGMALVLRLFEHHLEYQAPYDGYIEVIDADHDGLPDHDARLVNDEMRFGSSPNLPDTDDDGLNDLGEFTADIYQGSSPNLVDTDGDGIRDGQDLYPASNFQIINEKTTQPISVDGLLGTNEGWNEMGSDPFYSKIPNATLETFTTWDDDYLYFAFESNQHLKYFLKIDGSGEDGIFASDVRWPGGDYSGINENAFGDGYYDSSTLIIRADDSEVYKKEAPITGSQVETVFSNGIYTTEIKIPHNLGPGFGYTYSDPGSPTITELVFGEDDIIGIQLIGMPLTQSNGYEWNEWRSNDWLILDQPFHYYDMVLTDSNNPPGDYCDSYGEFPWEDWIAHVSVGSIDNASGKSQYSDFTNLTTDLEKGSIVPISLTTGYSYFTFYEYWRVWIDFNQDGDFADATELVFSGLLNAPPDGTQTATIDGQLNIPTTALTGTTRMRIQMKRGSPYPGPCDILPFGEVEDYSVNILAVANEADLELNASAYPTIITSGQASFGVSVKNNGPQTATNITVVRTPNTAFVSYQSINVGTGTFDNNTHAWSIPSLLPGETAYLQFFGEIDGVITPQVDFYEITTAQPTDPDSTPGNDNGTLTPDEDDEASIEFIPDAGPDLIITNVNAPSSANAGDVFDVDFNVENIGYIYASTNVTGIFLSTDDQWDANDIQVGEEDGIILDPQSSWSFTTSVNIPIGSAPGDYYLLLVADYTDFADEANEDNNTTAVTINVLDASGQLPNLQIVGPEIIPANNCYTDPGQSFAFLGGLVLNSGMADAGAFTVKAFLSKDDLLDANDIFWQEFSYPGVNQNDVVGWNVDEPVPMSVLPGSYFVLIKADADDEVAETNENDNLLDLTTLIAAPDFTVTNVNGVPANTTEGSTFDVDVNIMHIVPFPLLELPGDLKVSIYLSEDDQFSSFEDLEIGSANIPFTDFTNAPMFNNGTASTTINAQLPASIDDGTYYIFVNLFRGCERNTGNNNSAPIAVQIGGGMPGDYCDSYSEFPWEDWIARVELANLTNNSGKSVYSDFTNQSAGLEAGQSYQISLSTGFSYFTWDEYWRVWIDYNLDGDFDDVGELAFWGTLSAPPNGTSKATLNGTLFVPNTAIPGSTTRMRISMKRGGFPSPCELLPFGEVEDYTVNISSSGLAPNLRIPYIEVIAPNNCFVNPGESYLVFGGLVLNDGTDAAGPFVIKSFFSKDDQISPDDVFWKEFQYDVLAINNTAGFNINDPVPPSLPVGRYFVLTQVDPNNGVMESNENDNIHISEVSIGAPDFGLTAIDGLPATAEPGYNFYLDVEAEHFVPYPLLELPNDLSIKVYLSEDNIFQASNDTEIGMTSVPLDHFTNGPLFYNGILNTHVSATIPQNTLEGDYFIFVYITANVCEPMQGFLNISNPLPIHIESDIPPTDYCTVASDFPWEDWIAGVELNTIDNSSGKSAYSDFTSFSTTLEKGVNYPLNLTTGYSYFTWDEYWSVWIDLNQDYIFSQDELLFSEIMMRPPDGTSSKIIAGNINIPTTALNGPTRMRVVMKRGSFADPCEDIPFGEIEDYTVHIVDQFNDSEIEERAANISFRAVQEKTWIDLFGVFSFPEKIVQVDIEKSVDNLSFELLKTVSENKLLNNSKLLEATDEYPFDGSNYYRLLFILENGKEVYSNVELINFNSFGDYKIFPNPASSDIFIYLEKIPEQEMTWTINDAFGRNIWLQKINKNMAFPYRIDISDFKPGMYYLFVQRPEMKAKSKRFVVVK